MPVHNNLSTKQLTNKVTSKAYKVICLACVLDSSFGSKSSCNDELDSRTADNLSDGFKSIICLWDIVGRVISSFDSWLDSVDKRQRGLSIDDSLRPRYENGQGIGLTHALEAREGRHPNADALRAYSIADSVEDSQGEAESVFETAPVRVCSVIAVGLKLSCS